MDIRKLTEKAFKRNLADVGALREAFNCCRFLADDDIAAARNYMQQVRMLSQKYAKEQRSAQMMDVYKNSLLFLAPYDFDAYCIYIEWNRDPDKRFYLPRRRQLKPLVDALQRLADGKIELLGISLPPGVGKTTLAIFFLTCLAGKEPDKPILGGSHSNAFLRGVYEECQRIMQSDGEYLWQDVFPDVKVVKTNAQDMMIDLGTPKRFATLEFSSIGSGNAGKVRAEQLLYCDDLCQGIEEAMSRERLDNLWTKYSIDLRQRKIGACRELHIATRWSVHDVIGRLEQSYDNNSKAEFIAVPALDENEQSNFDYPIEAGFSTKFYLEQREMMDDASWRALYMNQPIEREGQLYNEDQLRRYFDLPNGEPDAVLAVCDTKDKGKDYCVMPVVYQYGQDFYVEDVICDNGDPEIVEIRLAMLLLKHKVHIARFESNSAGGKIAAKVQQEVENRGGITKITTRYTTNNKETKIIVNSPFAKKHCLFKDNSVLKCEKEYRRMLKFLCSYTMAGKNEHDDVPDAFAMLAEFVQELEGATVKVFQRPY